MKMKEKKFYLELEIEVINPIIQHKIFESDYNIFLNDKIWFSVKSHSYLRGNKLNYNLNENDIIKIGRKIYVITKIHFASDNIRDENFYMNNNISYVSIINKKSKPVFNINIKPNRYKIRNNKNINIEKENEEKANKIKEEKANKVNIIESKNIIQNINKFYIDNNINTKNAINSNNISGNNTSNQNNDKNGKNIYQNNSVSSPKNDHSNNTQNENENNNDIESENENENDKCWICLNSNYDEDNPLICLCNCNNFIHYKCLKKYLTKTDNVNFKKTETVNLKKTVKTYIYSNFNCDMCLKPYQLRFRIPELGETYELIDLPKENDYICLESVDYINNNNIKIMHIVQLKDQEIYMGRDINYDIIDNDIYVSREHALLKYNKNNKSLFLENKNERYGTLVLVRGNIKIREKTYFQILNTHISIEITKKKILINRQRIFSIYCYL